MQTDVYSPNPQEVDRLRQQVYVRIGWACGIVVFALAAWKEQWFPQMHGSCIVAAGYALGETRDARLARFGDRFLGQNRFIVNFHQHGQRPDEGVLMFEPDRIVFRGMQFDVDFKLRDYQILSRPHASNETYVLRSADESEPDIAITQIGYQPGEERFFKREGTRWLPPALIIRPDFEALDDAMNALRVQPVA